MRIVVLLGCGIVFSIFAIIAIAGGFTYNWPDFVHTNYGFPLVWGTHTLDTIVGPVDIWHVDIWALVIDMVLWLGALVATMTVATSLLQRRIN